MSMRAKMKVVKVEKVEGQETVHFTAVGKGSSMKADGLDEDNTYARFTPDAELKLTVRNPALLGALLPGDIYYLDFTRARDDAPEPDVVGADVDDHDYDGDEREPLTGLTFGQAITYTMAGRRIVRSGGYGRSLGAFVYLNKGSAPTFPKSGLINGVPTALFDLDDAGTIIRMPNWNMRTIDGSTVTGWLPSPTDLAARDWMVVE